MFHKIFRFSVSLMFGLTVALEPTGIALASEFTVSTTADMVDSNPGDGLCDTATGECSLRAAIQEANASAGDDTISLPAGTFTLSITGTGEDAAATGDLDITDNLTINGSGAASTIIDGNALDGIIQILNSTTIAAISNVTIQNGASPGSGGAIANVGTLTLSDSILRNNLAACVGSAIENTGTFTVNQTIITENVGGGIYCLGMAVMNLAPGIMTLNNTSVSNNSPDGGIYNYSTLTINNSTVSGNIGGGFNDTPGGLYNWSGTATINNSTISGNTTSAGGGIFIGGGGTLRLNNDTISNNTASNGGGVYNHPSAPGQVIMQNTILSSNTATNTGPDCYGTIGSSGYNLVGDASNCNFAITTGDLTDENPFLGPLQDNSGPTFTHALLPNSPAIDAGNPTGCTDQNGNQLTTDQRGVTRPQGIGCDIGAYEYVFTTPGPAMSLSILTGSDQVTATNLAFSKPLRVVALDSQGNRVSGVTVTFTAPASGASGTFAGTGTNTTTVITDAGGVATTSTFTANAQAGAYTVSASATGLGLVSFNLEQVIRPANDDFAAAQPFALLPFDVTVDITQATNEPNEPQNCYSMDRTVWYSFTPTETMVVQATTGSAANANLNIYQATGPGISDLQFLSCIGPNSTATFQVEANQTYYVQAGAISGGIGTIAFSLEPIAAPGNDNFANAPQIADLPYLAEVSTVAATVEAGEPNPTCAGSPYNTVWFAFTPSETRSFSAKLLDQRFAPFLAVYSGTNLGSLTELGCKIYNENVTFHADAGQTYYIQIGGLYDPGAFGFITLSLDVAPPAVAVINFSPSNPSSADTVIFCNYSYDPGNVYFQSAHWDFGDGTTVDSLDFCINHRYAADGDYTVSLAVTTFDGRTASTSQVVQVRTHDVGIVKVSAPNSASSRQTKPITVSIRNTRYPETVTVDLYKSAPGGDVWIGSLTLQVPVLSGNRTKTFTFNYTFTAQDAQIGKVTFRAVATINGANDAFPADNTGISSPPTKVTR